MRVGESSLWNEVRKDMFSLHTAQKASIIKALKSRLCSAKNDVFHFKRSGSTLRCPLQEKSRLLNLSADNGNKQRKKPQQHPTMLQQVVHRSLHASLNQL
jgi:hypothetical protein